MECGPDLYLMLRICSIFVLLSLPAFAESDFSGPVRVVDGDTIRVGQTRVRLQGIDAPESGQRCGSAGIGVWSCGDWVTAQVRERYEGRMAACRFIELDRYARSVAVCSVGGEDIGGTLVREGLAFAYRAYSMRYDADEKAAAIDGRGLHAVDIENPAVFRAVKREARVKRADASADVSPDCRIKGNISSSSGEKIYHEPGQMHYGKTIVTETRGERWFCSTVEAEAAGWRRAKV